MNPLTSTMLTILQYGGYLAIVTYVVSLLVWAAKQVIHEYWGCKAVCLKMTDVHSPDMASMFHAVMNARNGTHPESSKQDMAAEK